jgi:hypothetical protein
MKEQSGTRSEDVISRDQRVTPQVRPEQGQQKVSAATATTNREAKGHDRPAAQRPVRGVWRITPKGDAQLPAKDNGKANERKTKPEKKDS